MRTADCHTDRKHYAKGMCERCYTAWRRSEPERLEHINLRRRERRAQNIDHTQQTKREYARNNKDRILETQREWRRRNRGRKNESSRQWYENNSVKAREADIFRKYGMLVSERDAIIEAQSFGCAICGAKFTDKCKPNIDHCHTSNIVRGVLCSHCNKGLGHFRDNAAYLESAIIYLSKH